MIRIPFFQVDAFSDRPFWGNPAGVCLLPRFFDDAWLGSVAAEKRLPATAFLVREEGRLRLRWFSPVAEIDLCGHATLAAAFVLMTELEKDRKSARFETKSGLVQATCIDSGAGPSAPRIEIELEAQSSRSVPDPAGLLQALGIERAETRLARTCRLVVLDSSRAVRALEPDLERLRRVEEPSAVSVTAPGTDEDAGADFVSRYFAPVHGVPEDPVTGSAHAALAPFWAERLGRPSLRARQVGPRGGELGCEVEQDRVRVSGHAVLIERGELTLPLEGRDEP